MNNIQAEITRIIRLSTLSLATVRLVCSELKFSGRNFDVGTASLAWRPWASDAVEAMWEWEEEDGETSAINAKLLWMQNREKSWSKPAVEGMRFNAVEDFLEAS